MPRVLGRCCLGRIQYRALSSRALLKGLTRPQPGLTFALPPVVQAPRSRFAQPVFCLLESAGVPGDQPRLPHDF